MQRYKQLDVFKHTDAGKAMRSSLADAQSLTVQSLRAYGADRSVWIVGFSGGKDSTATVTFIDWAIGQGLVQRPESLILIYSDTLMELPSLDYSAHRLMEHLQSRGWQIRRSVPDLETAPTKTERFFVTMLGRGYAPPNGRFRWCTERMKTNKLDKLISSILEEYPAEQILSIHGIRKGESAVRDQRILASCSSEDGECGQGWFQKLGKNGLGSLGPILHWRVCHVWDWIVEAAFEHGYPVDGVITTYGVDITDDGLEEPLSARTGCMGCPLVTTSDERQPRADKALSTVLQSPDWTHLAPYARLSDVYWRLRWNKAFRHIKLNGQKGCLTLEAREWALTEILSIQAESVRLALEAGRTPYMLIADDEVALVRAMMTAKTYPDTLQYSAESLGMTESEKKEADRVSRLNKSQALAKAAKSIA